MWLCLEAQEQLQDGIHEHSTGRQAGRQAGRQRVRRTAGMAPRVQPHSHSTPATNVVLSNGKKQQQGPPIHVAISLPAVDLLK